MNQMKNKNQQRTEIDDIDYIDIPAFVRSMLRYTRRYILLVIPLIIGMTAGIAMISRPYAGKNYVAGRTFMIGVRLSGALTFDYNLSGLTWDRQSTLTHMNSVLTALTESGYMNQFVRDFMGKKRDEELNGQIYIHAAYSTNLVDLYVVSDSPEDAEAIRDAALTCLPDAVFPAIGFIEMDMGEQYTRVESSPRVILTSRKVWVAGGTLLGIFGYLGLVFLYTLTRRDVETPRDLRKCTDLPCLGRLPARRRRLRIPGSRQAQQQDNALVMTKAYQRAFDHFRGNVAEEIRRNSIQVILLTGIGRRRGQTTIAVELGDAWRGMGKKVIRIEPKPDGSPVTEETMRHVLNRYRKKADIILIDGPSCDQSADALVLADCADAVIMVIREGWSQPDEAEEMFRSLQYANAKPLGYVFSECSNI